MTYAAAASQSAGGRDNFFPNGAMAGPAGRGAGPHNGGPSSIGQETATPPPQSQSQSSRTRKNPRLRDDGTLMQFPEAMYHWFKEYHSELDGNKQLEEVVAQLEKNIKEQVDKLEKQAAVLASERETKERLLKEKSDKEEMKVADITRGEEERLRLLDVISKLEGDIREQSEKVAQNAAEMARDREEIMQLREEISQLRENQREKSEKAASEAANSTREKEEGGLLSEEISKLKETTKERSDKAAKEAASQVRLSPWVKPTGKEVSKPKNVANEQSEKTAKEETSNARQKAEIERLTRKLLAMEESANEQFHRAEKEKANCLQEKAMAEKYRALHVRAVNSIGSGLEPISDDNFAKKLGSLQHEVFQWCRTGFKKGAGALQKEVNMRVSAQELLKTRVDDITVLKLSELVDCVVWAFMEKFILSIWLPGLSEEMLKFILELESYIRRGDTTPNGERTSAWRSQTASLLFQDPQWKRSLADVSSIASELVSIACSVPQRPSLQERLLPAIEDSLRSVTTLAVEMKCQRGSFRLDESVAVKAPYNEELMQDVRCVEVEEGMQPVVDAVLSRGWIRVPPKEVGGGERCICKTRVLVGAVPKK